MSAEDFVGKLTEGQKFSIVAPHDNFEINLLQKILLDELFLVFNGKDYDKFDTLCNYIYYDSNSEGRFFFDLSEDPRYDGNQIAFYVIVHGSDEFDEDEFIELVENGEYVIPSQDECLVAYNVMEEEMTRSSEDKDYDFDVYFHHRGLMKIDLREAIGIMMSNTIQKI
jgi:hypothetical protein